MIRHRFLCANWPLTIRKIASKLQEAKYNKNSDQGFIIHTVRKDYLTAQFVEKYATESEITDPFGNSELVSNIEYRRSEFKISDGVIGLELVNPAPGISALFNQLISLTGEFFTIEPLRPDVFGWADEFISSGVENQVDVVGIQLSNVKFSNHTKGRIVVEGKNDVKKSIEKYVNRNQASIDKVVLQLGFDTKCKALLSKNGTLQISENLEPHQVLNLRESLIQHLNKASN